jgi:sulfite reductase alpha subunit-like flavoprotein
MTNSEIVKEINAIKDNESYLERSIDLLYKIQLSRGPLVEAITIIRFDKPRLYSILKTRLVNKTGFKIMFEVSVEHEIAKKSLGM